MTIAYRVVVDGSVSWGDPGFSFGSAVVGGHVLALRRCFVRYVNCLSSSGAGGVTYLSVTCYVLGCY